MQSDNCNLCGNCNDLSSAYRTCLRETLGPRFKAALVKEKKHHTIFFTDLLEGSTKWSCPAKLDLDEDVLEIRCILAKELKQPGFCKEIQENFRNHGNPVGRVSKEKNYKPYFG